MAATQQELKAVEDVRKAVAEARITDALAILTTLFGNNAKYRAIADLTRSVQADYSRLRSDEIGGTLSESELSLGYARINERVLGIAQKLEESDLGPWGTVVSRVPKRALWLGLLILGSIASFFIYKYVTKPDVSTVVCPSFDDQSKFRILILPFDRLGGDATFPEKQVRNELNELSKKYKISLSAVALEAGDFDVQSMEEASLLGQRCGAHMVIWGTYENKQDSLLINMMYNIVGKQYLNIQMLKISGDSGLRAVSTVSSIQSGGELLQQIDIAIRQIFGVAAYFNGEYAVATDSWSSIDGSKQPNGLLLLGADAMIHQGKPDQALSWLDSFENHGGIDAVAMNNKGMLLCQRGDFAAAVNSLQQAQEMAPNDTVLMKNNVYALELNGQFAEAKVVADKLVLAAPNNKWASKKQSNIAAAVVQQKTQLAQNIEKVNENPNNTGALATKAQANFSLGKTKEAVADAQRLIEKNPKSTKGPELLARIYTAQGEPEKAQAVMTEAVRRGVDLPDKKALKLTFIPPPPPDTTGN